MRSVVSDSRKIHVIGRFIKKLMKIHNEIVFCWSKKGLSVTALSTTMSIRPICIFESRYFEVFEYESLKDYRNFQVNGTVLSQMLCNSLDSLELGVKSEEETFDIKIIDRAGVLKSISLYLNEIEQITPGLNYQFDHEIDARITMKNKYLPNFRSLFSLNDIARLSINPYPKPTVEITNMVDNSPGISISFQNSPEFSISQKSDELLCVSFSIKDFLIMHDLSSVISKTTTLTISRECFPVIIKSCSELGVKFESEMSVLSDNKPNEIEPDSSQTEPWPFQTNFTL